MTRTTATAPKPVLSTIWSRDSEAWNESVDYLDPAPLRGGLAGWLLAVVRSGRGRRAVILRGTVTFADRYRDLLVAVLLRALAPRTLVVISDATLEPEARSVSSVLGALKSPLFRLLIRAADGPRTRWCVLSSDEVRSFPRTWGVDPAHVVLTPFTHTLWGSDPAASAQAADYVWSGGNSLRDYDLLVEAVRELDVEVRIATSQQLQDVPPHVHVRPVTHEDFLREMAAARVVVLPISDAVRSAGQQTYLNAMALGRVVVVTDRPGVRDHIEDGVTGVIAPPTVEGLTAALADVLDPARRGHYERMAVAARDAALERFTPAHYWERLLAVAGAATPPAAREDAGSSSA